MFTVDTDRIQAASSDMSGIAGDIESSVGAMHARLSSLEGSWSGAAAAEFQGLVTEWAALQDRVRSDLAQIAALTARASGTYRETEEGVRGMFAH
ncbi:WXG100 family type VII secretion target [Lapillicoccus sp.]|uniref:WXG100 family type VII secretion target n=1 Tax=Lapillicoccus sp. TaxID=1909287 RepID=UPI003266734C